MGGTHGKRNSDRRGPAIVKTFGDLSSAKERGVKVALEKKKNAQVIGPRKGKGKGLL